MFQDLRHRVAVGTLGLIATSTLGGIATIALEAATSAPAHATTTTAEGDLTASGAQQSDIRAALQTATVDSPATNVTYSPALCPAA